MPKEYFHAMLLLAMTSIGMAACAGNENRSKEEYLAGRPPEDELICRRQRPVGSHVPVHICRTRAQVEADREAALNEVGPLRTMGGEPMKKPPN